MLESKRRAAIFLFLAFILAVVAGYLVLDKVRSLNAELGGMTTIYIAKGNIPSRTQIQENQITTMSIPNKFVMKSHITSKNDLMEKVLVVPVSKGDIITKNMIKPVSNLREEKNRLVSLYRTEKIQFDQVIEALDRVDIIVSREVDGKKLTEIFMRDVPVAWAQGSGDKFAGVAVEINEKDAPRLIDAQVYANHIRVLKANVGKGDAVLQNQIIEENENPKEQANPNNPDTKGDQTSSNAGDGTKKPS